MSDNEVLILSLKAILHDWVNSKRVDEIPSVYYSDNGIIRYKDAIKNVLELIEKLESEVK